MSAYEAQKAFDPIVTAEKIADAYRGYIASTIHFDDADLQRQLTDILDEPGFLAKGPFIQATPPYRKGATVRELVEEGVLCRSMLKLGGRDPAKFDPDRPLYEHQERAIRKAARGRNYAVATGTGSGKTECFLLPIVNDILRQFEADGKATPGVRAMILYPMNALANDQLERLRTLLEGTDVRFGRYTGETEETEADAIERWNEEGHESGPGRNELISREAIRKSPPNILLTNYSMLEYLLLRPKDAVLFGSLFGSRWGHLAVDEAHVYAGSLGTEVAFLIRRLKARIESETGKRLHIQCYATSATIGSDSREDMSHVAQFAQGLFGEPFVSEGDDIDVITSTPDLPRESLDDKPWGRLDLDCWPRLRDELARVHDEPDEQRTREAVSDLLSRAGAPADVCARVREGETLSRALGGVLLGEESAMALVRKTCDGTKEGIIDLTSREEVGNLGIEGLGHDVHGMEILSSMVEVLSVAQRSEDVPVLTSRYHSFLRAPEGLYINLAERRLTGHKTLEIACGDGVTPVYEVSVCRHCGQAYILGKEENGEGGLPPRLSSRHAGTDADDEFLPLTYYRLLPEGEGPDENDETLLWLCPVCGSLHSEQSGGDHAFVHEPAPRIGIARGKADQNEDRASCYHCGYQHHFAIQPLRVSPEAAGAVVCSELAKDVPPFEVPHKAGRFGSGPKAGPRRAGSIICFSDRRQDAAFFAPSMARTSVRNVHRQLIREAVEARGDRERYGLTAVADWLANNARNLCPKAFDPSRDDAGQVWAWVLDELSAEDSRNSLDGLGVVRFEPTAFLNALELDEVRDVARGEVEKLAEDNQDLAGWLGVDDYLAICSMCLDDLRARGAVHQPNETTGRKNHGQPSTVQRDVTDDHVVNFVGSSSGSENKRSRFIRKYARRLYGEEQVSRGAASALLDSLYDFLFDLLDALHADLGLARKDVIHGDRGSFSIDPDLWEAYPGAGGDRVFMCDTCGCATHVDTHGVCMTDRCQGRLREVTSEEIYDKDRYYKELYREPGLALRIEEHTAQLDRKYARKIQNDFIKGDVNILSCTTTFELGVDVGDLRSVFMRNVPPTCANYAQRAGRVGRRAGKPGYAITFCRLRPHDIAYFDDPRKMMADPSPVPACYLDNEPIAIRHLFAICLSEFFRRAAAEGKDYVSQYHQFMNLGDPRPKGLDELRGYLESRPDEVRRQAERVFVGDGAPARLSERLDLDAWTWVDRLVGEEADEAHGVGRLVWAHEVKHEDYARVQKRKEQYQTAGERGKARRLDAVLENLEKERVLNVLAGMGVLPKYGFPTDLVELRLVDEGNPDDGLQLQRGMRQAIREYAPGSEVVANGFVWRSRGIRRARGQQGFNTRMYGVCPACKSFVCPIDTGDQVTVATCACGEEVTLKKLMLIPDAGFEGEKVPGDIGYRRPRAIGAVTIAVSQQALTDSDGGFECGLPGGAVHCRPAHNVLLYALNEGAGGRGFSVCRYCGAARPTGLLGSEKKGAARDGVNHWDYCRRSAERSGQARKIDHPGALGARFTSDAFEMSFEDIEDRADRDAWQAAWKSAMWAVQTAAVQMLQVPSDELGCTTYGSSGGRASILLYDNVPGGAGHAQRLGEMVEELLEAAYDVVANCSCGEETCCYGCISNYYNQGEQASLSRGAAKRILGTLLHPDSESGAVISSRGAADISTEAVGLELKARFEGPDLSSLGFMRACLCAVGGNRRDDDRAFVEHLAELAEGREDELEAPRLGVTFEDAGGNEADALLAWERGRVLVLGADEEAEFEEAFGSLTNGICDWMLVRTSADDPSAVINALGR